MKKEHESTASPMESQRRMLAQEFVGVGSRFGPHQGYRKLIITALNRKSFSILNLRAEGNFNTRAELIRVCFSLNFSEAKGGELCYSTALLKDKVILWGKKR